MPRPIQIDEEQNRAIRTQIAERLRTIHSLEGRQKVPRAIRRSIDRMAEFEQQIEIRPKAAPPLVPSLEGGWTKRLWPRRSR
jgi:hypothetical protein